MVNAEARLSAGHPLDVLARDVPRCDIDGVVLEAAGGLGTLLRIDRALCPSWSASAVGVVAVRDETPPPGSSIQGEGWFVALGHNGFDASLRNAGADARFHATTLEATGPPRGAHAVAHKVRRGLGVAVSDLDHREAGLLKGLTIGDTSELSPDTIASFRASGLSHVLAVSGSNVAIVLGAVLVCMRSLGHRARVALGYAALGLFVLVVGPDPSVLRAAAMGSIALACLAYGRTAEPLAALGLAIIAVVASRPGMLFSVGMQLSAAATAGIVVFCAPIERVLHRLPQGVRTMLAATLAAQIAVAPVLILVFGELSVVAPVANALALPAVAPTTVVGLAAGAVAVFVPPLGRLLATIVAPAASWVLAVADRAGNESWSLLEVPNALGWPLLAGVAAWATVLLRRPQASR